MKYKFDSNNAPDGEGMYLLFNSDSSDIDSNLEMKNFIYNRNKIMNSQYLKTNANIISTYLVLYILIFCIISITYFPNFYSIYEKADLYDKKTKIKYFSEYFSNQGISQVKSIN